jgi:hypothetical protein
VESDLITINGISPRREVYEIIELNVVVAPLDNEEEDHQDTTTIA